MTSFARISTALVGAVFLATPLVAQDEAAPADPVEVTADTVVARIGLTEITMGHVVSVRRQLPQQYAQLPDEVLFKGIVDQLVDQYLLSKAAESVDLSPGLMLKLENDSRALLATVFIEDLVSDEIAEADVEAAYQEQFVDVEAKQEYNASHILVETEETAQEVVSDLDGGADFAELAKERSIGPSGPRGGDLGWFGLGAMVPEFEQVVVSLDPGTVSEPVQTQFGWHVVRLNEIRDMAPPALTEVRGQIVNALRQQLVGDTVGRLREESGAELLIEDIPTDAFRDDTLLAE